MKTMGEEAARTLLKSKDSRLLPLFIQRKCQEMLKEPGLLDAMSLVVREAADLLGEGKMLAWLNTPKVALKGRSPAQVMVSVDGCRRAACVLQNLRKTIDEMSFKARADAPPERADAFDI